MAEDGLTLLLRTCCNLQLVSVRRGVLQLTA